MWGGRWNFDRESGGGHELTPFRLIINFYSIFFTLFFHPFCKTEATASLLLLSCYIILGFKIRHHWGRGMILLPPQDRLIGVHTVEVVFVEFHV